MARRPHAEDRGLAAVGRVREVRETDSRIGLQRVLAEESALHDRLATLESGIADGSLPGLAFTQDTAANAVFATLPTATADRIRERVRFYDWDRARGEVRWMAAWDTTEADVDSFIAVIREEFACGST